MNGQGQARLELTSTAVLVVDVQERLLPAMHNAQAVEAQVIRLLRGAGVLGLPVLVTEQYPNGLGLTTAPVLEALGDQAIVRADKLKFSACLEPVTDALRQKQIRSVLVCGIEAHVCVLQTCLDLLDQNIMPFLVVDAIGSRRTSDQEAAQQRMSQAGVVVTTVESALLEMVGEAGTPRFKAMLGVIK